LKQVRHPCSSHIHSSSYPPTFHYPTNTRWPVPRYVRCNNLNC